MVNEDWTGDIGRYIDPNPLDVARDRAIEEGCNVFEVDVDYEICHVLFADLPLLSKQRLEAINESFIFVK